MALTISNHNGTLSADHIWVCNLFQAFCTQQISFDRNLTFIDHLFKFTTLITFLSLLQGVWVFTRIPAGTRNRCIGLKCFDTFI